MNTPDSILGDALANALEPRHLAGDLVIDMKKSPVQKNRGSLVREGGVEPPRPHGHTDLNRARLPIPPLAHVSYGVSPQATHKTIRTACGAVQLREYDLRYLPC